MLTAQSLIACLSWLAPSAAPAPGPIPPQLEASLEDARLEPLASGLAAYFDARQAARDAQPAREELARLLAALSSQLGGTPVLASPGDLGRAVWLSRAQDARVRTGKVVSETLEGGSAGDGAREFAFWLPKDYDPAGPAYPLLAVIPDQGEEPAAHIRAHWDLRDLRDRAIIVCPAMPAELADWTRVMVNGRPGGLRHLLTVLRHASERFAVDFDRIFVAGRGKGVPAAVAAGNYSPQRFAGVIGRAGDAGELGPDNFCNLPTYFAGAGAQATAFQEAAAKAGFDNCSLDPGGRQEDVWEWLLQHPRRPYPGTVVLVPGKPFPTRAYWVQVSPSASDAAVRASIQREENSVRITAHGISHATLYLNDFLLDLDRPVTVICNGIETRSVVPRELRATLNMLDDGISDPGALYVARAACAMSGDPLPASSRPGTPDEELESRLAAAGDDADRLWELHEWCNQTQRTDQAVRVLRTLVRVHPDHEAARAALGHVRGNGAWFTSAESLARFERRQDETLARARGLVQYKTLWMHPDERALVTQGLVKDPETGCWLSAAERKRLAQGWARQDLDWIPPADAPHVDAGLWLVDGEWLDLAEADRRHARLDSMWHIPGAEILLHTTTDRSVALRAMREMRLALDDMRRVFGAEPILPLPVCLLRDEEQYDRLAAGDPDGRRGPAHAGRLHVVHSAFFAESWFIGTGDDLEFNGMGVGYWDTLVPDGDLYGVHAARLAAALSCVDALDPSPKAIRKAAAEGPGRGYHDAFFAEKRLPAWLSMGAAVYAERYFHDDSVTEGDPWWARRWSLDNLRARGELRPLEEILRFDLDPDDRDDGLKLLLEAGLVVAFVVDGDCDAVRERHLELQRALLARRPVAKPIAALTEAIGLHEDELRAFADM